MEETITMRHTEEELQEIIRKNCGSPPDPEKLQYTIWLNKQKLDFYSRSPFPCRGPYNDEALRSYQRLVDIATDLLVEGLL